MQKAVATIFLCVKPVNLNDVKKLEHAVDVWNALKELHQSTVPVRKVTLFKRLLNLRLGEGENVQQHVQSFQDGR